jgi:phytanoyl-CoA hydroxylase
MQTTEANPPTSPASGEIGPDGLLRSDLWLDQPDAPEEIARRRENDEISAEEASNLERFWRDGFFVFRPEVDDGLFDALDRDVDRLWEEQPPWVAYAYGSLLTRFSGRDGDKRLPASRIADLHEFSTPALELYLHLQLFRYVELILGQPALATQSLYFQWGSQQALHRDPIHVRMTPPNHLVAAWIALEDIQPGCGELRYVPGSHRLPYYEFEPGRYAFDHHKDTDEQVLAGQQWDLDRCAEAGLEAVPLHCRRGECLVWHHSLLHGGSYPATPGLTRKSFVVHYTSRANMAATKNTYVDPYARPEAGEPDPPVRVYPSDRTHRLGSREGFVSPLLDRLPEEVRERFDRVARAERRILELEADLAASRLEIEVMKASRFWKLRDAWWKLRRAVGRG